MTKTFRERLTDNANDFDQIVSEILAENETLKAAAARLSKPVHLTDETNNPTYQKKQIIGKPQTIESGIKEKQMSQITTPELKEGEHYAGTIIQPDGTGHHVILLPNDKDDGEWQEAMDWAKEQGGDLPNRVEQSLLFAESKDQFQKDWYWSSEQHASDSSNAWFQHFENGYQYYRYEDNTLRARAVRRLAI